MTLNSVTRVRQRASKTSRGALDSSARCWHAAPSINIRSATRRATSRSRAAVAAAAPHHARLRWRVCGIRRRRRRHLGHINSGAHASRSRRAISGRQAWQRGQASSGVGRRRGGGVIVGGE
jgi:hypothetical protein